MNHKINQVLTALLLVVALLTGQSAWAESSWTVTNPTGSTFRITRPDSHVGTTEKVKYRTVNLSAYAGQHYTAKSGEVTFGVNDTYKDITVSETTPGTDAYKYQNSAKRKYRFDVTDLGGFYLAHCDHEITTGTSVPSSGAFNIKDVTIYSNEYTANDDGYDVNGYKSVASSAYFTSSNAPKAYLQQISAQLRMTLSFQGKENDDAYEYLQLLFDNTSSCDNRSGCSNGDPGNISLSSYMAGFEMNTGAKDDTYRTYTFPVTSVGNNEGATDPWGYDPTNHKWPLKKQKFKSGSRASDGRLIVPMNFSSIVLRLNASGSSGSDEWAVKEVNAHIQAVDGTAPTILDVNSIVVAGGLHGYGNTVYISVPFNEIVTVTGTPTLSTTWGTLNYEAGSGSNVLTFSGTITANVGTSLTVSSISGTVKDLAGNSYNTNTTINKSFDNLTVERPWAGSGTENAPYIICNTTQLDWLAKEVWGGYTGNSNGNYFNGAYFKLGADIAYSHSNTDTWDKTTSFTSNFTSIGGWGHSFQGTFDGDGHSISGIRIYKSGTADTDQCQGLFGMISTGAMVKNLILYDANIVGYMQVGGITGSHQSGTIQDCYVYNTRAKGTYNSDPKQGIIRGSGDGTITRAYYKDCMVGSNAGQHNIVKLTLNDNATVSRTPVTNVNATLTTCSDGATINSEEYYTPHTDITLGYNGSVPQDQFVKYIATTSNSDITTSHIYSGNVLTMPNADVTVSTTFLPVLTYLDADGIEQQCSDYTVITGSNSNVRMGASEKTHWYVVSSDATINALLEFMDATANLILCDGATLTVNKGQYTAIDAKNLNIFGQTNGNGTLNASASTSGTGIGSYVLGIYGGIINASGSLEGINALDKSIILGYAAPANRLTASSYQCGSLTVKAGQTLTDGEGHLYSGTYTHGNLIAASIALKTKTLQPAYSLTLPDNFTVTGTTAPQGYAPADEVVTLHTDEGYHITAASYTPAGGSATDITPEQDVWSFSMPTANTTVTATRVPNTYTVTFDMQGGDGSASATATYDAAMPDITPPTRTGYTFGGYYTATNGGGIKYYNADGTSATTWDITSETTLYAKWTAHTYILRLHHNKGTDAVTNQTLTYDVAANIQSVSRTGYVLSGWSTTQNGSVTYTNGQEVLNLSATQGAVIDLYAQWANPSGTCGTNATWEYNHANGTLTITGSGKIDDYVSWQDYKQVITTVIIGSDITSINGEPFANYTQLATVTGGDGLTFVDASAFNNTKWLDAARQSTSVVYLGKVAFCGRSVSGDVTINDGTVNIATKAFENNTTITSVTVPASVSTIESAFSSCTALTTINVLADTPPTLGGNAFFLSDKSQDRTFNVRNAAYKTTGRWADIYNKEGIYAGYTGTTLRVVSTLALPDGVTASAAAADKVTAYGTDYYAAGTSITLSAEANFALANVEVNGTPATDNGDGTWSFTMPAADATVTATVSVSYIAADGTTQYCSNYTLIESHEGNVSLGTSANDEAWYVVPAGEVTISGRLLINDKAVYLILCDGAELTVTESSYWNAVSCPHSLTIYGQSAQSGSLTATATGSVACGIKADEGDITVNGGIISAISNNYKGIWANNSGSVTINRGSVTATSNGSSFSYGIQANNNVTINGGIVTATGNSNGIYASGSTITLGWTNPTDRIYANSYSKNPVVKSGQTLTDDTNTYSGSVNKSSIAGKTLWPDLWDVAGGNDGSTAEKAYTITTTGGLDQLAAQVNSGNFKNFEDKFFRLGNDITYTHTTNWDDATSTENNYTAIGADINGNYKDFCGTFDGQGYTVRGIRIYKGNDDFQGLFGSTLGATIKNVNLADARITGRQNVGGIAGYVTRNNSQGGIVENCRVGSDVILHAVANYAYSHGGVVGNCNGGTISGCVSAATLTKADGLTDIQRYGGIVGNLSGTMSDCLALGCSVPAVEDDNYGAIAVDVYGGSTLTNCYYRDCKVGNAYNQSDAYTVSAGTDVTVAPTGSADQTYPHDGIQRYGTALYYNGVLYAPEAANVSLTLGNTAPTELFDHYTATAGTLSGSENPYTLTMPAQDVTINAFLKVPYIDENGVEQLCADYIVIDEDLINATSGDLGTSGETHWYVVKDDVYIDVILFFNDQNAHLILCDGGKLSVNGDENAIYCYSGSLTIYGQSLQSGILNATANLNDAIYAPSGNITINGGNINAQSKHNTAINASNNITINGGNVLAIGCNYSFNASTITLGWTNATDRIDASRPYACPTLKVKDGLAFADEDGNLYSGTIYSGPRYQNYELAGKTMQPAVALAMNSAGIMTYASPYALDLSNVNAYVVSSFNSGNSTLTLSKVTEAPANTGLLLKAKSNEQKGTTVALPLKASAEAIASNMLVGVLSSETVVPRTDGDYTNFILANGGTYGIDWYTLSEDGVIGANKAYLQLLKADLTNLAREFTWVYDDGETTEMNEELRMKNEEFNATGWYTLEGRKLDGKPTKKGLYIHNGRKVLVP